VRVEGERAHGEGGERGGGDGDDEGYYARGASTEAIVDV
jgi:hypothetical protein